LILAWCAGVAAPVAKSAPADSGNVLRMSGVLCLSQAKSRNRFLNWFLTCLVWRKTPEMLYRLNPYKLNIGYADGR
jgi:hypothetical protein